ncbi:deoxynucleoside kinase-like isoform X2 [Paramacrobiotus metropolitanus]|uniref:deoxynucleoside kinase-like isoform X2 n=1 Tax=Paramacrobiotus metropolitanus TaxID=2943436 RepID=UPI0024458263|nr:deoxynucleoside kinase-like isoform X2 [Paramacrobiotus metropolitanus]
MAFSTAFSKSFRIILKICFRSTRSALNDGSRSFLSVEHSSLPNSRRPALSRMEFPSCRRNLSETSNSLHTRTVLASDGHPSARLQNLKHSTILVEGNIGCGKAEFLRYIESEPSVQVSEEPIDLWRNKDGQNLLDLMYKDPKKNSYKFQQYVLETMVDQHDRSTNRPVHILERSFYSARYIFVENLWRNGLMSSEEYQALDRQFRSYLDGSRHVDVDLIVYIRASPETVHKRILHRGREEEKNISVAYLSQLHNLYEAWLIDHKFPVPAQVLVIDGEAPLEKVFQQINNERERILYSPASSGSLGEVQPSAKIPIVMT